MQKQTLGERTWILLMEAYCHAIKEQEDIKKFDDGEIPEMPIKWKDRGLVLQARRALGYTRFGTVNISHIDAARPHTKARMAARAKKLEEAAKWGYTEDEYDEIVLGIIKR